MPADDPTERLGESVRRGGAAASEALGYFDGTGNDWRRVECLRLFGDIHRAGGDDRSATRCFRAGLDLARRLDARVEVSLLEDRLAELGTSPAERDA